MWKFYKNTIFDYVKLYKSNNLKLTISTYDKRNFIITKNNQNIIESLGYLRYIII